MKYKGPHLLTYKGRINDCTGKTLEHYTGRKQVVTQQIYDPNINKTTLIIEFVDELEKP